MTRRGQMNLMALAAIAIVVIAVLYLILSGEQKTRELNIQEIESVEVKDELVKLESSVEALFIDSIYESVDEMGRHGGYTAENAPLLNHLGIPHWYYRGRTVSIPTAKVMEDMLVDEIERRLGKKLDVLRSQVRTDLFAIGYPEAKVKLHDHAVETEVSVPIGLVADEREARTSVTYSNQLPLRIKYLRDLAEQYIQNYTEERMMEKALLNGVIQDQRLPTPPGMISRNVDCDSQTVYAYRKQIISPMRENAQLSVARELKRVKELFRSEQYVEWAADLNVRDVNFTFIANKDADYLDKTWESTEVIYYVPFEMPLMDRRAEPRLCPSRYTVSYSAQFPVRWTLRDIHESSFIIGGEGSEGSRPLEFRFYIQPLLVGEQTNATDESVMDPATVDDLCRGACDVDITVKNSNAGTIYIGACSYPYTDSHLKQAGVPCKVQDLIVVSDDPVGLSKHVDKVKIDRQFGTTISLKDYAVLTGKVFMKKRIYCTNSGKIVEMGEETLGHIDGNPPRYVTILFKPVHDDLGPIVKVGVDRDGKYTTPQLNPGRYIVLAVPSEDDLGRPQYKVSAKVLIIDVETSTTLDIEMNPLLIEKVGGKIEHVSARSECTG